MKSAYDTDVGERRSGQGALAPGSISEALAKRLPVIVQRNAWTMAHERELMTEFYRRIWVAKEPKWRALWEAKKMLREAKDESGRPRYSTRDWAAWMLTGEPE